MTLDVANKNRNDAHTVSGRGVGDRAADGAVAEKGDRDFFGKAELQFTPPYASWANAFQR